MKAPDTRRGWLRALLVVGGAAVATVGMLTGCGDDSGQEPAHTPYTVVSAGTYRGSRWQLFAWTQSKHLCLLLLPGGSDPGHLTTPAGWPVDGGGGCQFDEGDPAGGYFASSAGPGGSSFSFGPLPLAATQIQVAAHEVLPTSLLPRSSGLPAGRFWVHLMPAGWPTPADGQALDLPQPLDSQGRPVDFQAF